MKNSIEVQAALAVKVLQEGSRGIDVIGLCIKPAQYIDFEQHHTIELIDSVRVARYNGTLNPIWKARNVCFILSQAMQNTLQPHSADREAIRYIFDLFIAEATKLGYRTQSSAATIWLIRPDQQVQCDTGIPELNFSKAAFCSKIGNKNKNCSYQNNRSRWDRLDVGDLAWRKCPRIVGTVSSNRDSRVVGPELDLSEGFVKTSKLYETYQKLTYVLWRDYGEGSLLKELAHFPRGVGTHTPYHLYQKIGEALEELLDTDLQDQRVAQNAVQQSMVGGHATTTGKQDSLATDEGTKQAMVVAPNQAERVDPGICGNLGEKLLDLSYTSKIDARQYAYERFFLKDAAISVDATKTVGTVLCSMRWDVQSAPQPIRDWVGLHRYCSGPMIGKFEIQGAVGLTGTFAIFSSTQAYKDTWSAQEMQAQPGFEEIPIGQNLVNKTFELPFSFKDGPLWFDNLAPDVNYLEKFQVPVTYLCLYNALQNPSYNAQITTVVRTYMGLSPKFSVRKPLIIDRWQEQTPPDVSNLHVTLPYQPFTSMDGKTIGELWKMFDRDNVQPDPQFTMFTDGRCYPQLGLPYKLEGWSNLGIPPYDNPYQYPAGVRITQAHMYHYDANFEKVSGGFPTVCYLTNKTPIVDYPYPFAVDMHGESWTFTTDTGDNWSGTGGMSACWLIGDTPPEQFYETTINKTAFLLKKTAADWERMQFLDAFEKLPAECNGWCNVTARNVDVSGSKITHVLDLGNEAAQHGFAGLGYITQEMPPNSIASVYDLWWGPKRCSVVLMYTTNDTTFKCNGNYAPSELHMKSIDVVQMEAELSDRFTNMVDGMYAFGITAGNVPSISRVQAQDFSYPSGTNMQYMYWLRYYLNLSLGDNLVGTNVVTFEVYSPLFLTTLAYVTYHPGLNAFYTRIAEGPPEQVGWMYRTGNDVANLQLKNFNFVKMASDYKFSSVTSWNSRVVDVSTRDEDGNLNLEVIRSAERRMLKQQQVKTPVYSSKPIVSCGDVEVQGQVLGFATPGMHGEDQNTAMTEGDMLAGIPGFENYGALSTQQRQIALEKWLAENNNEINRQLADKNSALQQWLSTNQGVIDNQLKDKDTALSKWLQQQDAETQKQLQGMKGQQSLDLQNLIGQQSVDKQNLIGRQAMEQVQANFANSLRLTGARGSGGATHVDEPVVSSTSAVIHAPPSTSVPEKAAVVKPQLSTTVENVDPNTLDPFAAKNMAQAAKEMGVGKVSAEIANDPLSDFVSATDPEPPKRYTKEMINPASQGLVSSPLEETFLLNHSDLNPIVPQSGVPDEPFTWKNDRINNMIPKEVWEKEVPNDFEAAHNYHREVGATVNANGDLALPRATKTIGKPIGVSGSMLGEVGLSDLLGPAAMVWGAHENALARAYQGFN